MQLPEAVTVVRAPPGAKDLKTATKISVSDISVGDRVLVRGKVSDDQKSVAATSVIVMNKADVASAHEAERMDWQRRGIGGLVKAVNPEAKEATILLPRTTGTKLRSSSRVAPTLPFMSAPVKKPEQATDRTR